MRQLEQMVLLSIYLHQVHKSSLGYPKYRAKRPITHQQPPPIIGSKLKNDIKGSFTIRNAGKVDQSQHHYLTHTNQADYARSNLTDTGMPNGNCYLRGEGAYGDAGREGWVYVEE